jgi:NAD(P)-dependent dehydrogenase (short-subunit alcohol dehydrogenase family)
VGLSRRFHHRRILVVRQGFASGAWFVAPGGAFDDIMLTRGYSGSRAYAQSKLAQIMFTFDLARELDPRQ